MIQLQRAFPKIFINSCLVMAGLFVGALLFEVGLRLFNPVEMRIKGDKIVLFPGKRIIVDGTQLPKFDSEIIHTRNAIGLRGDNPPNDFDSHLTLIAIGGSTTEGYYLSDGMTWPEQLNAKLRNNFKKIWVNNAGMDGHTTFGHIKLFEQHVAGINPDVILIMAGINDRALSKANIYDESIRPTGGPPKEFLRRAVWYLGRNSEVFALGLTIFRSLTAVRTDAGHGNISFAKIPHITVSADIEKLVLGGHRRYLSDYAKRLTKLVEMAKKMGIRPILVTQAAMWGEGVDPVTGFEIGTWRSASEAIPGTGKKVKVNGRISWRILELYNDTLREVGETTGVLVVDLGRIMSKNSRFFYDWYHFTNEGAEIAAEIIAWEICPYLAIEFSDHAKSDCPSPIGS